MKRLALIVAITLSLLIIYSGVGVSIMHYCCASCETVQSCCSTGCSKCAKSHACDSKKKDCKEEGCTATIYKVDLAKYASEVTVAVPVVTLFCEQFNYLWTSACVDRPKEYSRLFSPPPPCPRQRLALHSVFII